MDIKAQLRKYKIQLAELRHTQELAIQKEKQIHEAETARIAIKKQDYREECQINADNLKQEQMNMMETLALVKSELLNVDKELGELARNKFKLREEVLHIIHAENKAKKDIRRNKQIFLNQINDIQTEIAAKRRVIAEYETTRRHINEDYYNWKAECVETEERITVLQDSDKKRAILMAYLEELRADIRSQPEKRYEDLDIQKQQAELEISQLEYQCNKLTTYMNKFNATPEHEELIVSSYLRDKKARIPELKAAHRELSNQIVAKQAKIDEYDTLISMQLNAEFPAELLIQEARAHQRLEIATYRTVSEYKTLIDRLVGQIHDLEQELLKQMDANNSTQVDLVESQPHPADIQVARVLENQPVRVHETTPSMTGKSRKEIERLEKQKALQQQLLASE